MNIPSFHFYQLAVCLVALLMIYFGLEKYLRGGSNQSLLKLLVRLIVWGGMGIVAAFPPVTLYLAHFIGLEGNINAVILIGFLLVFLLIFKILSVVERIEHDISVITRNQALQHLPRHERDTQKN